MNRELTGPPEGRTFFIILNLLVGIGVLMAVAAIGTLIVAALTF
ncbi:MAG: hypothetical protein ACE5JQ_10285 [Candidatus Methylomirabilales bacterium]